MRVKAPLLLVGSLPASDPGEAMRDAADLVGGFVFALPDGETGRRANWVGYERQTLTNLHPDIIPAHGGEIPGTRPLNVHEIPALRIRPGVSEIRWETWPRIDDAIESYRLFAKLRAEGVIPPGVRFQVGLPLPFSVFGVDFKDDPASYAIAERAFADLQRREVARLLDAVPPSDLAIQVDIALEFLLMEGVGPWPRQETDRAWETFAVPAARLAGLVPPEVLLGFHLCYGTFPQWPMFEAWDSALLVNAANWLVRSCRRPVDWLHLAGPRQLRSEDSQWWRPMAGLVPGDARVFLGIVLPEDGAAGLRRRAAAASAFLGDFGVARYCGFGREHESGDTLARHAAVVRAYLEDPRGGAR